MQREVYRALEGTGLAMVSAARIGDALRILETGDIAGVMSTLDPLRDDEAGLSRLIDAAAPNPVFLLVAQAQVAAAYEMPHDGVRDVVRLPIESGELRYRLRDLLSSGKQGRAGATSRVVPQRKSDVLLGNSARIQAVRDRISMIAHTDLPVAVYGESGTGKELAARMVHCESPRRQGPFVVTNCTALPEPLFENDLFGHERGSFTGAYSRQGGLLDAANGGTIVFDEIGDLSLALQAKLLRLLQFRTYRRVGGTKTIEADVRIIVSTNVDLVKAVKEGTFRSDLYYRINVLQISMPPLREHREDLPVLVNDIAIRFCRKYKREPVTFADGAIAKLRAHHWPGNVRELESVVQSALALRQGARLDASDLEIVSVLPGGLEEDASQSGMAAPAVDLSIPFAEAKRQCVDAFERAYLTEVLRRCGGNVAGAARAAGHDRKSFWRLLQKHEIDVEDFRGLHTA